MKRFLLCPRCKQKHRIGECPIKPRKESKTNSQYDYKWHSIRGAFLRLHPNCSICGKPAEVVHHILPVSNYPELRYNWENLQALCNVCHARIHSPRKKKRAG